MIAATAPDCESGYEPGHEPGYDAERARADWQAATAAIDLAVVAPAALGGVVLRGGHGAVRDALLQRFCAHHRLERLHAGSADEAFDETLDVAATLSSGRAVRRPDLLARLDAGPCGALLIVGVERLSVRAGDRLARWLESPGRHAPLIALDESEHGADDATAFIDSALGDRIALHLRVPDLTLADLRACLELTPPAGAAPVPVSADAPEHVPMGAPAEVSGEIVAGLVRLAQALGIESARAPIQALAATCACAALANERSATLEHSALAARLVLAPRATRPPDGATADETAADGEPANDSDKSPEPVSETDLGPDADASPAAAAEAGTAAEPATNAQQPPPEPESLPESLDETHERTPEKDRDTDALPERLVAAVSSALPADLLGRLASQAAARRDARRAGRTGGGKSRAARGRPAGVARPGAGDHGRRLDTVATLKAAVPWQRLRARLPGTRLAVRPSDFRIRRYTLPTRTTTVFIVDTSGSAAMHRIGEAKGALESVLAECYVRRDRVALISFRGSAATLELPPTRSLARARRSLVGLAAGGGTPIAAGLDLAGELLHDIVRGGERAVGIIMSDGRANVGRDGLGGRIAAQADAEDAARRLAGSGARLLFVDTAPRPRPVAAHLAGCMSARYLPLPPRGTAQALPDLLRGGGA